MGFMERFFGREGEGDARNIGEQLVANPAIDLAGPMLRSLQVLFPEPVLLETENLKGWLRAYDPELARATCEIDPITANQGTPMGLIGWSNHVIQLVGFNAPLPREAVEKCLPPHYPQEVKDQARTHQANVILYYAGYEQSVLEQYVALAAVAGTLCSLGAVVVLNEAALTSVPASVLTSQTGKDTRKAMGILRVLPLLVLYCGFGCYAVEGTPCVWMRTHGSYLLGLPDLAICRGNYDQAAPTFDIFTDILNYLLESGAKFAPGHTMQVAGNQYMRLRLPREDEYFLDNPGEIFVAELTSKAQMGR